MMQGQINAQLEAVLQLRLRGPNGSELEFNAILDTGYTGSLTISQSAADSLGLMRRSGGQAMPADGSSRQFDTYTAEVWWGHGWRQVVASALGDESLVGMKLPAGHSLRADVISGGIVLIVLID